MKRPGPFVDYRLGNEELFVAVFTSRIIEPTARRNAPQAVDRIEEIVTTIVPTLYDGK